jgi:hypothetical protein
MPRVLRRNAGGGKDLLKHPWLFQVLYKSFKQVAATATLGRVSRMLDKDPYILVVSEQRCCEFFAVPRRRTTT